MKILITIINIISALAIIPWPAIVISGAMAGDSPKSGTLLPLIILIVSITYPLIIAGLIYLSQNQNSLLYALLGLTPLIFFVYVFFFSGGTAQKDNFNTLKKDFVCDSNSFLYLGGNETDPIRGLEFLEKRNFFTYKNNDIATIYGNKWINPEKINTKDIRDRTENLLNTCKNNKRETPVQSYIEIPDNQVKDILKTL